MQTFIMSLHIFEGQEFLCFFFILCHSWSLSLSRLLRLVWSCSHHVEAPPRSPSEINFTIRSFDTAVLKMRFMGVIQSTNSYIWDEITMELGDLLFNNTFPLWLMPLRRLVKLMWAINESSYTPTVTSTIRSSHLLNHCG